MGTLNEWENAIKKTAIDRRQFFVALVPVFSVPAILWWVFTAGRTGRISHSARQITIAGDIPSGLSLHQGVILVRSADNLRAFEAKCTHLGCQLNKIEDGEVVCPCHGSRFNEEGKPVKGPASRSLNELSVRFDAANNTTIVK